MKRWFRMSLESSMNPLNAIKYRSGGLSPPLGSLVDDLRKVRVENIARVGARQTQRLPSAAGSRPTWEFCSQALLEVRIASLDTELFACSKLLSALDSLPSRGTCC